MSFYKGLVGSLALSTAAAAAAAVVGQNGTNAVTAPTAHVKNGTYFGTYNPTYGTDYFLGMPFAQPPVGNLRFRVPQSLNSSWSESRNATQYGYECIGYGLDTESQGNYVSEDCLTLNVVRSRGSGDKLPVVVSIRVQGTAKEVLRYATRFGFMEAVGSRAALRIIVSADLPMSRH